MINASTSSSDLVTIGSNHPPERALLSNHPTNAIIGVENTNVDLHVINKESFLFNSAMANENLKTLIKNELHDNQPARFNTLGAGITAIANICKDGKAKEISDSICDKYPRNRVIALKNDSSINKRGEEYIRQFLDAETPLDSTSYALGLQVGSDMNSDVQDSFLVEKFNGMWNIRLKMIP